VIVVGVELRGVGDELAVVVAPARLAGDAGIPSLSSSGSQRSPRLSPSLFAWFAFATVGQLSHASPLPSPSVSVWS